jgi:hypothetical protein
MLNKTWGKVLGAGVGAVLLMAFFQNCARVGLKDLEKGLGATNTIFACTETTKVCEKDGVQGTMSCQSTDSGPQWGDCVTPGGPPPAPLAGCTFKGMSYVHGQSFVAYEQEVVPASGACKSQLRTCLNGAVTGNYQFFSCSNESGQCNLGGVTVQHNQTIEAFQAASVPYGQTCKKEIRRCFDGALNGSYNFLSCVPDAAAACPFNGQMIPHLGEVLAYEATTVPYGADCKSQKRACNNGILSGTYPAASCMVQPAAACQFNGQNVPNGTSVTAYQTATVAFDQVCKYQQRNCVNGDLSGSYTYASCAVDKALTCVFNGQTIAHNAQVNAYREAVVPFGQTCARESRTCSNGNLSGSYMAAACTVAPPLNCSINNMPVAHNGSIIMYSAPTVPFGSTCASIAESRTCVNGNLAGTHQYSSCTVNEPATCVFNGQTVAHGANVKAYYSASVTSPDVCSEETRACYNGNLSGTYGYPGCYVYNPPTANCQVYYQARNDSKISGTGMNGSWALFHSDDGKDCDRYPGCGIRMGISCVGEAQARLNYQFKSISIDSPEKSTPWSGVNGAIQWGDWSLVYQPNQPSAECLAPRQCGIRVGIEVQNGKPCSISYNYKVDKGNYTPVAYDGAWSLLSRGSGQGDNCDDDNCGMRAQLTCHEVTHTNPPPGGGSGPGGGRNFEDSNVNLVSSGQSNDGRMPASAEPEVSFWTGIKNWFASLWATIFG